MGGWISFCLSALLVSSCHSKPVEEDEANAKEVILEARETPKDELSVTEDVDENEVKRYNDYMDAVYRRMNAALRAKLMDPMELNLDPKEERKAQNGKKNKRVTREADDDASAVDEVDNKDIVEMDTQDEAEDPEIEVDRMGELENEEKTKKKKKKNGKKNGKKKD